MKQRILFLFPLLAILSCNNASRNEDYRKLILGTWKLDSIRGEDGVMQNLEVFLPYAEFDSTGHLTYWGIEDHKRVYDYRINNSVIYSDSVVTQTDSIITLNNDKMVLLLRIRGKNQDGSPFRQTDTYYYARKK